MRARLLTAAIGIPIFLGAALAGGVWWFLLVSVLIAIGLAEWHGFIRKFFEMTVPLDALFGGGLLVAIAAYNVTREVSIPGFGVGAVLLAAAVYAVAREAFSARRRPLAAAGATVLGVVYVGGLLSHLVLLRGVGAGQELTLLAIVGTWLTDTGAFFVGRSLGGRRLVPALSPGKTVSGAIGGWVAGFLGVLLTSVFLLAIPLPKAALLAAVVPIAAQLGDLLESSLKREAGVKDSGKLLPGHGGVLDRFDSLMLVAPAVYYIAVLL